MPTGGRGAQLLVEAAIPPKAASGSSCHWSHPGFELGEPGDQRQRPVGGPALALARSTMSRARARACSRWSQPAQPTTACESSSPLGAGVGDEPLLGHVELAAVPASTTCLRKSAGCTSAAPGSCRPSRPRPRGAAGPRCAPTLPACAARTRLVAGRRPGTARTRRRAAVDELPAVSDVLATRPQLAAPRPGRRRGRPRRPAGRPTGPWAGPGRRTSTTGLRAGPAASPAAPSRLLLPRLGRPPSLVLRTLQQVDVVATRSRRAVAARGRGMPRGQCGGDLGDRGRAVAGEPLVGSPRPPPPCGQARSRRHAPPA